MNYFFKSVGYDQSDLLSMPTIIAEVEIMPNSLKEWSDIHKVITSTSLKELEQFKSIFNFRPSLPNIKNVYFSNPATVVLWDDGTKTIVKCQDGDTYSKETGLALCVAKKAMGNKSNFNDIFKKWIPEEKKPESEKETAGLKTCQTCKYSLESLLGPHCYSCDTRYSNWKPNK